MSDVVERATEVINSLLGRPQEFESEYLARALHDAALLTEPKLTDHTSQLFEDIAERDETWWLRGEFIDALARLYVDWRSNNPPARALVAHLDGEGES